MKRRDGQMNRVEERQRQTDRSNRHLQPHRQYMEVLHLQGKTLGVCVCVWVEVNEYVPVIAKGK